MCPLILRFTLFGELPILSFCFLKGLKIAKSNKCIYSLYAGFLLLGMGDRGQFRSKDPVKIFEIRG